MLGTLATSSFASADHLKLGSKGQLDGNACDKEGKAVINVEEKVLNDVDSGFVENWAIDNYTRQIKVWKPEGGVPNQWCAVVKYEGKFDAVEGRHGPGDADSSGPLIGADVRGEMRGGYRATFTGDLKSTPLWPTHGSVGTVDYGCDITGSTCTYLSWPGQYFDNFDNFDQPWWGWIYKAKKNHGTWLNQIDVAQPDSGNIL